MSDDLAVLDLFDDRWTSFVAASSGATPFHHPAWSDLLARTYGFRAFAVAACDSIGHPVAGAPFLAVRSLSQRRRWISLPFTDECPPLARDGYARQRLVDLFAIAQERHSAPCIEVRGLVDAVGWRASAEAVTHVLGLDGDIEHVHRGFSRSRVVRNVARAEREGVTVRRAAGAEDLEAFYALHVMTRRRQGVPVQPRRFFDLLWSRLVERGLASILLADVGREVAVAGGVFLHWNGTTIYKFGASDPRSLSHRPNHAIFMRAIEEACARGDRRFDFGRTDLTNAGLRAFKSGWGACERPLRYSRLERGAAHGVDGRASRVLGAVIRHAPDWVCRGLGAALYRYAASR